MRNIILFALLLALGLPLQAKKKKKVKEPVMTNFVMIETTLGNIKVELFEDVPLHTANFKKLVSEKFYDSCLFHRIIKGFMIQGGDPTSKNAQAGAMLGNGGGDMERIPAEFMPNIHYHKRGALAAARDGNPAKASSACQFYIVDGRKFNDNEIESLSSRGGKTMTEQQKADYKNIGGAPHLDGDYTVYGQVIEGIEVVDKIANSEKGAMDRPAGDVRIIKMIFVEK